MDVTVVSLRHITSELNEIKVTCKMCEKEFEIKDLAEHQELCNDTPDRELILVLNKNQKKLLEEKEILEVRINKMQTQIDDLVIENSHLKESVDHSDFDLLRNDFINEKEKLEMQITEGNQLVEKIIGMVLIPHDGNTKIKTKLFTKCKFPDLMIKTGRLGSNLIIHMWGHGKFISFASQITKFKLKDATESYATATNYFDNEKDLEEEALIMYSQDQNLALIKSLTYDNQFVLIDLKQSLMHEHRSSLVLFKGDMMLKLNKGEIHHTDSPIWCNDYQELQPGAINKYNLNIFKL